MKNLKENLKWLFENCLYLPDSSIPKDYVLNHMVSDFAEVTSKDLIQAMPGIRNIVCENLGFLSFLQ